MRRIVFYSWQSDLPNSVNRGFIQQALETAAQAITADDTVAIEPVIDRDTQGVPGAPDIASTIFSKVTAADAVVADISMVGNLENGRPSPNPNVLIELGYALRTHGFERVILVFNQTFGRIEDLPFDLRMRRVTTYNMPEEAQDRGPERKRLTAILEQAIRAALQHAPRADEPDAYAATLQAIEDARANRIVHVRRMLSALLEKLVAVQPTKFIDGGTVEDLLTAIEHTQEPVADFSKLSATISLMDDQDMALEVCRWFGQIFERYDLPQGFSGRFNRADFDYYRFLGNELYVSLIAALLREQRWDTLRRILDEPIPVRYLRSEQQPGHVFWNFASEPLLSLHDEGRKRNRVSLQADILETRHSTGGLAALVPIDEFIAADFFLYLLGELPPVERAADAFPVWRPWSALYMEHTPMFIRSAEQTRIATELARALKVPNVTELKLRLAERAPRLTRLFRGAMLRWPIRDEDIERIATR